jgi:predicted aspartyl protease
MKTLLYASVAALSLVTPAFAGHPEWHDYQPKTPREFQQTYHYLVDQAKAAGLKSERVCFPNHCIIDFVWFDNPGEGALMFANTVYKDDNSEEQRICYNPKVGDHKQRCIFSDGQIVDEALRGDKWEVATRIRDSYPDGSAAPTATLGGGDVPFTMVNGAMQVQVVFGDKTVDMMIDTGANTCSLPEGVVNAMVAAGFAKESQGGKVLLADGSEHAERRVIVKSLTLGGHTSSDVLIGVAPEGSPPLLCLPILTAIGKFTIDGANHKLTLS